MNRPDLENLQQLARRDDWHRCIVGSDIRVTVAYALQMEKEAAEWKRRAEAHLCDGECPTHGDEA